MPTVRKDFIEQAIEQLVEALAALAGFRKKKDGGGFEQQLGKTCLDLLGIEYGPLTAFGAAQAAALLQNPRKIWVLAQLVAEHGELKKEQGNASGAAERWSLALSLCLEAKARTKAPDEKLDATIDRLEQQLADLDGQPG